MLFVCVCMLSPAKYIELKVEPKTNLTPSVHHAGKLLTPRFPR